MFTHIEKPQDLELEDILEAFKLFGGKQEDYAKLMGISSATLSHLVTGKLPLTKWRKISFYFFIETLFYNKGKRPDKKDARGRKTKK